MRRFRALFLLLLPLGACSCEEETLTPRLPGTCEPTFACGDGFEYRLGTCKADRCLGEGDCCPGQRCNAATGICTNLYEAGACSTDAECLVPGTRCIAFRGGRFCGYPNRDNTISPAGTQACVADADCGEGRTCFGTRCVTQAPCEGGCPEGQVCDVDSNACAPIQGCTLTCTPGSMLIVSAPDSMSGPQCCLPECACATLPPVAPGQFGWYANLAVAAEELLVSAYDPGYGDLVVARYDLDGRPRRVDYVDGFPGTGTLVGNPAGPRGGRAEPGPDVGKHTSIAVDPSGTIHVAYYDADQGALRYASFSGGTWKTSLVDDTGDTGYYTSLAIGPDGTPRIAYMMVSGTVSPDPTPRTALKLATSRTNLPTGPSDWTIDVVDSAPKPALVCGGGCASDQACVDLGTGPACQATTIGCGMCGSGEACVADAGGMARCTARVNSVVLDDLVEGTGLFASLALTSTGTPIIGYYDRLSGALRMAEGFLPGVYGVRTLDLDPMRPRDVGAHVSVAVGPQDRVGLAYMDQTNDDLLFLEFGGAPEVVDNGVTPPDVRLVGADASLVYDAGGSAAIAYQDPTTLDLVYARRLGTPPRWTTEVLRGGAGSSMMGFAAGFYVAQSRRDARGWIVSVDVGFTPDGDLRLTPVITQKTLD
jgi:hypothetical protein